MKNFLTKAFVCAGVLASAMALSSVATFAAAITTTTTFSGAAYAGEKSITSGKNSDAITGDFESNNFTFRNSGNKLKIDNSTTVTISGTSYQGSINMNGASKADNQCITFQTGVASTVEVYYKPNGNSRKIGIIPDTLSGSSSITAIPDNAIASVDNTSVTTAGILSASLGTGTYSIVETNGYRIYKIVVTPTVSATSGAVSIAPGTTLGETTGGTTSITVGGTPLESETTYDADSNVVITATPKTGYKVAVTVNNKAVELDNENKYSYTVNGDSEIAVTYTELASYSITLTGETPSGCTTDIKVNGSVVTSGNSYLEDSAVVVTATPDATHYVVVKVNDETVTLTSNAYTFNLTSNTTINVSYAEMSAITVTLKDSVTENPITGATISGTGLTATDHNNGTYTVAGLTSAKVEIIVSKTGYGSKTIKDATSSTSNTTLVLVPKTINDGTTVVNMAKLFKNPEDGYGYAETNFTGYNINGFTFYGSKDGKTRAYYATYNSANDAEVLYNGYYGRFNFNTGDASTAYITYTAPSKGLITVVGVNGNATSTDRSLTVKDSKKNTVATIEYKDNAVHTVSFVVSAGETYTFAPATNGSNICEIKFEENQSYFKPYKIYTDGTNSYIVGKIAGSDLNAVDKVGLAGSATKATAEGKTAPNNSTGTVYKAIKVGGKLIAGDETGSDYYYAVKLSNKNISGDYYVKGFVGDGSNWVGSAVDTATDIDSTTLS